MYRGRTYINEIVSIFKIDKIEGQLSFKIDRMLKVMLKLPNCALFIPFCCVSNVFIVTEP